RRPSVRRSRRDVQPGQRWRIWRGGSGVAEMATDERHERQRQGLLRRRQVRHLQRRAVANGVEVIEIEVNMATRRTRLISLSVAAICGSALGAATLIAQTAPTSLTAPEGFDVRKPGLQA